MLAEKDDNPVTRAKDALGGKLEDLARAAGVTIACASRWQQIGRIPLAEHAYRVALATEAAGKPVTIPELARFAMVNGRGGKPPAGKRTRGHRGRANQKKTCADLSLVKSVHGPQATKQQVRAVERNRQFRIRMAEGLTAAASAI